MSVNVASEPPFGSVARQMNKLVDQMSKGYYNFLPNETWTPSVNLYETETAYVVCVDLAGVDKEKIDLTVADQRLKLRGARAVPIQPDGPEGELAQKRVKVHLMEIDHGGFNREVELPHDVEHDKISANYRNGLLWIELPKK
jgi:HSP20 family protein